MVSLTMATVHAAVEEATVNNGKSAEPNAQTVSIKEINPDLEVVPLAGSNSVVWKYFGLAASGGRFVEPENRRNKVFCQLHECCKNVKYSGNTATMHFHLKECHHTLCREMEHTSQKSGQ